MGRRHAAVLQTGFSSRFLRMGFGTLREKERLGAWLIAAPLPTNAAGARSLSSALQSLAPGEIFSEPSCPTQQTNYFVHEHKHI